MCNWRHIDTKINSVDIVSRGKLPSELIKQDLWWHGSPFLMENSSNWCIRNPPIFDTNLLERRIVSLSITKITQSELNVFEKYSSLSNLINVTAYCKRFYNMIKTKTKTISSLGVDERTEALNALIRNVQ